MPNTINFPISQEPKTPMSRRGFLRMASGVGLTTIPTLLFAKSVGGTVLNPASLLLTPLQKPTAPKLKARAKIAQEEFSLSFYNLHTGESLKKCIFWAQGKYNSEGLKDLHKLFRDHRTNTVREIDRDLLHLLHKIHRSLGTIEPFHLISGYRSPKSNAMLNSRSRGVAKNSLHVYGKAADVEVPGRSLKQLQSAAKVLRSGGVGRYTQFVHVDTGRVRYWGL
jgi:uncharacterized protein YcbK (DUF882 family)